MRPKHVPSSVQTTPFARFHRTRQLFSPAHLDKDKFPALIEDLFDITRDVDHLARRNNLVIAMYISIKHLLVPEAVSGLSVLVEILDFRQM